ncbi:MAG: anti-sigma-factor antagonist [Proteobacteria bacterium]|nr:anti-sigma-factor antagonist [Pseudomonadota bacterium]
MVFSFFKKPPEKMVARPAAVPRSAKSSDAGEDSRPGAVSLPPEPAKDDRVTPEFSDFVFSESAPDFQIEGEIDPVDAQAEEAAILFANAQDDAVRAVLENAVRIHRSGVGERLWLMLFDVYQFSGTRAPFEALGIDYARSFEKSPPGWRDQHPSTSAEVAVGSLRFTGDLCAGNDAAFAAIVQSLDKNRRLRLDLSTLSRLDAAGCARLLALLQQSRKARHELDILGRDTLATLLEACVETGRAEDQACWLLLLEVYQLRGQYESFEEVAINYAVTFEVSPPSWEAARVAAPEPAPVARVVAAAVDTYALRGEIKSSRFGDLPSFAELHDPVVVDCAALRRIDFISAGALLNVLTTIRRTGKQIVFHHPNHLVAELFGIVGLKAVATIIPAKY